MNNKILLVDDDMDILPGYQRNLRKHFNVTIANSGLDGLKTLAEHGPFAVVMSDFNMPNMNGIDFLANVGKYVPDTVRIMITGFADLQIAINAVNQGKVFRFLTKPIDTEQLLKILEESVLQYRLITSEKELLENTLNGSIKIMVDVLSAANPQAFSKANRIRSIAKQLAEKLGMKNLWEVEIAALLSQIGIISVPQDVLDKEMSGEELTYDEALIINSVTHFSAELVKNIPRLESVAHAIKNQNTDFIKDSSSEYKIYGKDIPVISRILRIAADFDSLSKTNPSANDAFNSMLITSEKYDPEILNILNSIISGVKTTKQKKAIPLKNLRITMTLAEDMKDDNGVLLLANGREITDVVLMKIINIAKVRRIAEPVFIYE